MHRYTLTALLGLLLLSLWTSPLLAQEDFKLLKPFGYSTQELTISPATYLELRDTSLYEGEICFTRSPAGRNILSFPQADEYFLLSFKNNFRKEIYRKTEQAFISKDFSLYVADIISLYLYDIHERQWVNPLLILSKEVTSTLDIKEVSLTFQGTFKKLRPSEITEIESQQLDLLIKATSYLLGKITGFSGFYGLALSLNGLQLLSFTTQAIKQGKNGFEWLGLDTKKGFYEKDELRIKDLPLKLGMNELQIEVRDFLYRSLVFRVFIKVVRPLVR